MSSIASSGEARNRAEGRAWAEQQPDLLVFCVRLSSDACPNPCSQTCSLEIAGLLKVIKARW